MKKRKIFNRILSVIMTAAMLSVGVSLPAGATEIEADAKSAKIETMLDVAGFTELEGTVFTADQMDSKMRLASHADEIDTYVPGEDYVANEVVVEAEDIDTAREYADAYNAKLLAFEYGKALLEFDPDGADIEGFGTDMVSLAVDLSSDTAVDLPAAWPNYYDEFFDISYDYSEFDDFGCEFDDPLLLRSNSDHQWYHEMIGSNAAWRAGFKGQGVKVVVIDSGISDHEDITWDGAERLVRKSDGTFEVTDEVQAVTIHGTPVSAIIRAKADNGLGGAGIAPQCGLYMIRVDDDSGSIDTYTESVALDKAVEEYGADVVNLSIGGPRYAEYYEKSVRSAYEHGVAVVCAAGNEGTGYVSYPAAYSGAIAVSSCDRSGERSYFSNYGEEIRYSAPGQSIVEPYGDSYKSNVGTSFSAPIISGMAAVMLGSGKVMGSGSARVDEMLRLLDKSCTYVGDGNGKGVPSLSLALGLDSGDQAPGAVRANIASGVYEQEELTVELSTDNSGSTHADVIFYSDDGKNVSFTNGVPSANAKKYDKNEKITITGKRTTMIKAIAVSPVSGLVSDQVSYTYTLKPLVSDIEITTDTGIFALQRAKDLILTASCFPEYAGDTSVTYEVTEYPDGADRSSGIVIKGNKISAAATTTVGKYTVTCTANDRGHCSKKFDVVVTSPNRKVSSISASKTSLTIYAGTSEDIDIELVTTRNGVKQADIAQDYSTWKSSAAAVATASINGNILTVEGKKAGSTTINGVSNDGTKVTRSISVKVLQHPESVTIKGVAGDKVAAGKSVKLSASVLPANTTDKTVTWSIVEGPEGAAEGSAATINSKTGIFSAKKAAAGIYTVRAAAKDKNNLGDTVCDDYRIEVTPSAITNISLARNSTDIYRVRNTYGSSVSDSIKVTITGGSPGSLSIVNSNPGLVDADLVEKDDGLYLEVKATANAVGTCRIKVTSNDGSGRSAACTVSVLNPPSYLELSNPLICSNLAKGKSVKLTPKFGTAYGKLSAKAKKLVWTTTDPEVISVDQKGTVTARSELGRSATVTAKTTDGLMSCSLRFTSVAAMSSMSVYGPLKYARRLTGGTAYWEPADTLEPEKTYYVSLENTTEGIGKYFSSFNKSYCDVSVDKQGLTVKWSTVGADRDIDSPGKTTYSQLALYANKSGTYTLTIRMRDKSAASRKIKIVVK